MLKIALTIKEYILMVLKNQIPFWNPFDVKIVILYN